MFLGCAPLPYFEDEGQVILSYDWAWYPATDTAVTQYLPFSFMMTPTSAFDESLVSIALPQASGNPSSSQRTFLSTLLALVLLSFHQILQMQAHLISAFASDCNNTS